MKRQHPANRTSSGSRSVYRPVLLGLLALAFALSRPFVLEPDDPPARQTRQAEPAMQTVMSSEHAPAQPVEFRPASLNQLRAAVAKAIQHNFAQFPAHSGESRHELNRRLQASYYGADIVVFAFEGTAEFEPRMNAVMQQAARDLYQQGLSPRSSEMTLQYASFKGLSQALGRDPNWSGLLTGPLDSLLQDPDLQARTQWLSFPSESFEALSRITALQEVPLGEIFSLLLGSPASHSAGIEQALAALKAIQAQARALGRQPQIVIVTHSSGICSAIRFIEAADPARRFPLLISIDPVPEAHLALGEVYRQVQKHATGQAIDQLLTGLSTLPGIELPRLSVPPPLLRHRSQPESLYQPDKVGTLINFYQQQDTQGLRMQPRFGIHGSPVSGAVNQEIRDVGPRGHSEISYHPEVTRIFVEQLHALLAQART